MPDIHNTAIIDPQAQLADDVVIGPGCFIEGPVSIGSGTRLIANVFVHGPVSIGSQNLFYPNVSVGFAPQDRKFDHDRLTSGVRIGNYNVFRESASIHRSTGDTPTTVGDDNYFMVNTHVGHDCLIQNHVTLVNGALTGGHVTLEDHVMLGGNAGVHQFCRVGRLGMIAGNEGVSRDLPPFCTCHHTRRVASLNLVGLRRAGFRDHIPALKRAFDILYRQNHTRTHALQQIETCLGHDPLCMELVHFIRQSKRGITGYTHSREIERQGV